MVHQPDLQCHEIRVRDDWNFSTLESNGGYCKRKIPIALDYVNLFPILIH